MNISMMLDLVGGEIEGSLESVSETIRLVWTRAIYGGEIWSGAHGHAERYGVAVAYEETVGDVAKVVEAVGVAILVVGPIGAFALYARDLLGHVSDAYSPCAATSAG